MTRSSLVLTVLATTAATAATALAQRPAPASGFTLEQVKSLPYPDALTAAATGRKLAWELNERGARLHGPPADRVRRGRRPGADLDLDIRGREMGRVRPGGRPWLQLGGPAAQPGIPAGGAQGADLVGAVRRRRGQAAGRRRLPDDLPEERCRRVRERQPDLGGADRRLRAGKEDDRRQRHPGRRPVVARRLAARVRLPPRGPRLHRRL